MSNTIIHKQLIINRLNVFIFRNLNKLTDQQHIKGNKALIIIAICEEINVY